MDRKLEQIDQKFEQIDRRLQDMNQRLEGTNRDRWCGAKIKGYEHTIIEVESNVLSELDTVQEHANNRSERIENRLVCLERMAIVRQIAHSLCGQKSWKSE